MKSWWGTFVDRANNSSDENMAAGAKVNLFKKIVLVRQIMGGRRNVRLQTEQLLAVFMKCRKW